MIKLIKIIIIFILISNLSSLIYCNDNKLIQYASELDLILLNPIPDANEIIFKKCNDKLYFTSKIIDDGDSSFYELYEIDKNKTIKSYKIFIPNKLLDRIWLKDFEVKDNFLYLSLQYEI